LIEKALVALSAVDRKADQPAERLAESHTGAAPKVALVDGLAASHIKLQARRKVCVTGGKKMPSSMTFTVGLVDLACDSRWQRLQHLASTKRCRRIEAQGRRVRAFPGQGETPAAQVHAQE